MTIALLTGFAVCGWSLLLLVRSILIETERKRERENKAFREALDMTAATNVKLKSEHKKREAEMEWLVNREKQLVADNKEAMELAHKSAALTERAEQAARKAIDDGNKLVEMNRQLKVRLDASDADRVRLQRELDQAKHVGCDRELLRQDRIDLRSDLTRLSELMAEQIESLSKHIKEPQ
jgi:sugar-specific transcriptional regulator TrmB